MRVAAGAVFYDDPQGAIHRLSPDGQTAVVATFPITDGSRQELSFAVSRDGRDLVASILTTPPHRDPGYFGDSVFDHTVIGAVTQAPGP